MGRRRWLRIWTGTAVTALLAGAGMSVWSRLMGRPVPVWMPGLIAYGAVFCIFLWVDQLGRSAARLRAQQDARTTRPRPRPQPGSGRIPQRGEAAAGPSPQLSVRLVRVRQEESGELRAMMKAEQAEVLALDGIRPAGEAPGEELRVRDWLTDSARHAFFVEAAGERVGCAVVRAVEGSGGWYRIESLYVKPAWRRRRVGRQTLWQLAEFCRLAGGTGMAVHLSPNNGRARGFVAGCGFALARPAVAAEGRENEPGLEAQRSAQAGEVSAEAVRFGATTAELMGGVDVPGAAWEVWVRAL
jgi:GNAT superfamily N-acetyltransferase